MKTTQWIDLRSDTVTKPTAPMLESMMEASVGDDIFGEDPTVSLLESKVAQLFGKEAGIFCPSGTMTNQIAIKIHTQPGDEVICDQTAHIYHYEGGGVAYNAGVSLRMIAGNKGRFTATDVLDNINPDDIHFPKTSLISIENTSNKGGGSIWDIEEIKKIAQVAALNNLRMHLDGARVFNAVIESPYSTQALGKYFNTISVCLSKGLGAPVGSVLVGSHESVLKAKRVRKVLGGAMRQAGYLAAAGIYALDHHIDRLAEDHQRAKQLEEIFVTKPYVQEVLNAGTNIVVLKIDPKIDTNLLLSEWKEKGLLAVGFGKNQIRLVTHLDFTDEQLQKIKEIKLL
ncbi:aminotransferase class I/II-fold pyridoxal phosphate-dependent enzyme [Reichenbachiella agarivorans]|uniref:Aminotransferase class I/II-fold pyridoxal phosphate-dependent enzyme n=1 Tax=Reichenbachiella agarivorans TaxID=2979464 RepID=A0ABY6CQR1_9BACT|nr:GntG family PLP-dependent aldolase [Reichenbachiella agarivorans]UXP32159.1 aminotransferase class I/II-fold pyridoxal phosphate-dependent enzyme [Reichenbachiella agarivorans]